MAIVKKPQDMTAVWGIQTETGDTFASAKILSQRRSTSAETEPLLNSEGETVGLALYDQKDELEIEVVVEQNTQTPTIGQTIQIAGVQCICQGVDVAWEQRGWKKLSIKATKYHAMGS